MSRPASGRAETTVSSQAESSSSPSAVHAKAVGVDESAVGGGPRRGSRTRKPTSRAAGLDPTETSSAHTRSSRKRKADDASVEPEETTQHEVDTVFAGGIGEDKHGEAEDENQYCICRGKDDGSFMISCEQCQEWFHTKCVGMTQKAAKKLDEYICEACSNKASNAKKRKNHGSLSRVEHYCQACDLCEKRHEHRITPTHLALAHAADAIEEKYKSSKGRQAARATRAHSTDLPSDEEEKEDSDADEDSASDSDEYIGEAGDDASNYKDATMQDVSQPSHASKTQHLKQYGASTYTSKAKKGASSLGGASESQRRASVSSKVATTSKKGAAHKPSGPTDASTEEARSRAQKEELFEANADAHGSIRIVGSKYKDRFRTFLFSLKDAKNTTLHSRIASGLLQAAELAKMSNEELANDAIRQATEKARLEALHRSTLRTDEAGPLRKMTHKGEIEIESDALVARDQPGKSERVLDKGKETGKPPATRITESEPAISASAMYHEKGTEATASAVPEDDLERRSAPAPSLVKDSPTRLNFGNVWTESEQARPHDQHDEPQESYGFGAGSPHDVGYDQSMATDADHDATGGADDFIDSFLDGPDDETGKEVGGALQSISEQQVDRSTTPSAEPPSSAVHRYRSIIWNGLIDLPDIFAFQGHVKQIAGRSLSSTSRVWPKFFPERPLLIAGRLPSKAAVDYLLQVVNAPRTEILAFTMEPGATKQGAVQAQESDLVSFDGMLKHFKNADRWGALHISSSVKGSLIKDFYVVPLYKDEEVPLWLDMAESDCLGADWHTKRDRDLLVLVAVVIRDALQAELSKAERPLNRHRSATNDGETHKPVQAPAGSTSAAEEAYDPSAGLSIPLGNASTSLPSAVAGAAPSASAAFGSDALQSLLRTLGKTTAPPPSANAPTTLLGGLSPFGAAPPGSPPPGPPPGPPPAFPNGPAPANAPPTAGSWSPLPASGAGSLEPQHWQQQPYSTYPQGYSGAADLAAYGPGMGWAQDQGWQSAESVPLPHNATPPQPQEMPEEEYPGQYNPDFLAQASAGGARGGAGFGGRGRGYAHGHGQGFGGGRGRGGWARGRNW
ncbi:hypothetical protein [Sporisorium scitamineum]|uniref:Transcription factor BYE1 n=1 Tax=Sporisorium scitamineum TaxID=49012 RepID=A0A0F7RZ29_9BASI|nr:hypothetical protein [Sporisorium scitamineum]